MIRDAYKYLISWKNRADRKPLIIQGARQVGKTWLMKELGKNEYLRVAYFNFEFSSELHYIFKQNFDIKRIIASLEIACGENISPKSSLIIFDEIQACPEAITSLKYFHENASDFHLIAAGSLLGVAIHQGFSFPVGKVDFLTLYPLNFHEYLSAVGANQIIKYIELEQLDILIPFAETLKEHVKTYLFLGGMPEVVLDFVENNNFLEVRKIQSDILQSYENDFSKHAPITQLPKIRMVWQSIVGQLAKENSKFIYKILRSGSRAKEFETAIDWLKDAGLIHKVLRVNKGGIPLSAYTDWSNFKIFLCDVGLLGAMAGISPKTLIEGNRIFEEFKGILTEQFVCQHIISQSYNSFYWSPDNGKSEVDFIIQKQEKVIPIEVKASDNVRSRSLHVYFEKYQPTECVRTSLANYEQQSWMKNIPLYFFQQWLNENSGL